MRLRPKPYLYAAAGYAAILMRVRYTKIILSALAAFYVLLVCFNNTFDYGANFEFVRHVLSMDDVFSPEKNGWRGLHAEWMHHAAYLLIIAIEYTIALLLVRGTWSMWRAREAETTVFRQEARHSAHGYLTAFVLWFGVFVVGAGEWFLMWQSQKWNGETTAFTLSIVWLLMLIQHNLKEE